MIHIKQKDILITLSHFVVHANSFVHYTVREEKTFIIGINVVFLDRSTNINVIYFTLTPKANLEMNKKGLAADLVCMLDERSLPRDKAKFEAQIAGFFIAGAARIDLIAKVIDLDNDIGGYNFDIINLEETSNNIQSLSEIGGKNYYLIKLIELATESSYSILLQT